MCVSWFFLVRQLRHVHTRLRPRRAWAPCVTVVGHRDRRIVAAASPYRLGDQDMSAYSAGGWWSPMERRCGRFLFGRSCC